MATSLPPPPKFSSSSGPQSPSDWGSLFRWFMNLWKTTSSTASQQTVAMSPRTAPAQLRDPDAAAIASYVPRTPQALRDELAALLRESRGGKQPADELTGMLVAAVGRPPYPQAASGISQAVSSVSAPAIALNTVYSVTPKEAMVTVSLSMGATDSVEILSDGNNPPTTVIAAAPARAAAYAICITFWVLAGNYYKIAVIAGTPTLTAATEWY